MDKYEFLERLCSCVVSNDWDLPRFEDHVGKRERPDIPNHPIQEALKEEGRKRERSKIIDEKLIGYGLEAYGHFYRSLESAAEQKRKHPEKFEEYFCHWLHSDPGYLDQRAFNVFADWFPKPTSLKIEKGDSFWRYRA